MRLDVVCTTIGDGTFLKEWGRLIRQAGRHDDVRLVIIPDRRTPASLYGHVAALRDMDLTVVCPVPTEQLMFLEKLDCRPGFIPWNSDNRRNVGYLMAWADGADVVISVDDDNVPLNESWFHTHETAVTSPPGQHSGVSSPTGWFSSMRLLSTRPSGPYWPRGFPFFARTEPEIRQTWGDADIAINAGVWLGDPDVDAVTRLGAAPVAWASAGPSVVLDPGTWMPVSSQNTAVRRDVLPACYFARMPPWGGRFGDIFQGYFAQACAKHLGHAVRVGTPLVRQDRNDHNLLHDLQLEFPFYRLLEQVLTWLPEAELEGSTYRDTYESLSHALDNAAEAMLGLYAKHRNYLHQLAYLMRYWLRLCDQIGRQ
jgi:Reversibly glycosylated polypeptide